jgi:alkylhydroperoxidase/carboxymuconolactone decarboxylase family protein YurZ
MVDVETGLFTVGVFQNADWAGKGIAALRAASFPAESFSMIAKADPTVVALVEQTCGGAPERLDVAGIGPVVARGPLLTALQGDSRDLGTLGIAATMRRVGYQPHDGRIYETLVSRGGVLVAIKSDPRAADALAIMLSYGGGNAAIGAWTGRV